MPRTGQIIPSYSVPHVMTVINDNSNVNTTATAEITDPSARYLCIFRSSRGEDGVVKTINTTTEFLKEYGTPDFNKYGQPNLMPYALLSTGRAQCHCLRVTASDAKYATVVVRAKASTSTDSTNGVVITLSTEALGTNGLTNLDEVETAFKALENSATSSTGYPLFVVYAKGKGTFGNSLSVKLSTDASTTKETDFIHYIMNINDNSSGTLVTSEQALATFNESAVIDNVISYIDDVINDPENGSGVVGIYTSKGTTTNVKTGFERLIDDCNAILSEDVVDIDSFDIFTGKKKNATTGVLETISVAQTKTFTGNGSTTEFTFLTDETNNELEKVTVNGTDVTNSVDHSFSSGKITFTDAPTNNATIVVTTKRLVTGVTVVNATGDSFGTIGGAVLRSGSDGTFTDQRYIDAFNGTIAREVKSKRSVPCEYILDANYSDSVKKAMVACAVSREDTHLILDAGVTRDNVTALDSWYNNIISSTGLFYRETSSENRIDDHFFISKECQWYKTRDPFTNRIIPVTMTYFIAQNHPTHIYNYGNQIPFVGGTYATLTGHIRNTLKPIIDSDDLDNKEILYNDHFNFFEGIAENTFVRATQSTSQTVNTDLSEENNVDVLLEMKRMLESFVNNRLYNFANSEDRIAFTEDATRVFTGYTNNKVSTYDVYFDMNEFEAERSILHCYLAVTFRSMGKRGIIEIDINKRTS